MDRIYATHPNRVADAAGHAFWVSALHGGMSETEVARGFLTSEEDRQARADTAAYPTGLDAVLLGRMPDPDGLAGSQAAPEAGMSPAALVDSFLGSEVAARQADANGYYADYLGRAGSAAEVSGWVGALQSGLTPEQVAVASLASDEFHNKAARQRRVDSRPPVGLPRTARASGAGAPARPGALFQVGLPRLSGEESERVDGPLLSLETRQETDFTWIGKRKGSEPWAMARERAAVVTTGEG